LPGAEFTIADAWEVRVHGMGCFHAGNNLGGMAIASMARWFHFPIFGSFSSSVPCQHVFSSGK